MPLVNKHSLLVYKPSCHFVCEVENSSFDFMTAESASSITPKSKA